MSVPELGDKIAKHLPIDHIPELKEIRSLPQPKIRKIKVKDLITAVDLTQRKPDWKHIAGMLKVGYNPASVGVISVVGPVRDGKYLIVDGSHRTHMVYIVNKQNPETEVWCCVEDVGDQTEDGLFVLAAWRFRNDNTRRKDTNEMNHHKVGRTEGKEDDLAIDQLFREMGINLTEDRKTNRDFGFVKSIKKFLFPNRGKLRQPCEATLYRDKAEAIDDKDFTQTRKVFEIYQGIFNEAVHGRHYEGMMLALWATSNFYGISNREIIRVLKAGIKQVLQIRLAENKPGPEPKFSPRLLNNGPASYSGTNAPVTALSILDAWNLSPIKPFNLNRNDIRGCVERVGFGATVTEKYTIKLVRRS